MHIGGCQLELNMHTLWSNWKTHQDTMLEVADAEGEIVMGVEREVVMTQ